MIEYRDDLVIGISPKWRLRPDHGRGLIYKHSINDLVWQWVPLPIAISISLMDGKRPAAMIVKDLVQLLSLRDEPEGLILFKAAIGLSNEATEPFLIELKGGCDEVTHVNLKRFLELNNCPRNPKSMAIGQLQIPLQLLFMPTNECRTNCIYCYSERRAISSKLLLSPKRWGELIDEAGLLGIDMLVFSGGDPLLYHCIDYLLQKLAKWRIEYVLPTKTYISYQRAQEFSELCSGGGTIQISIDGVSPDVIDHLVGYSGFCKQAWSSIDHLVKTGVRVRTQSVVTPLNLSETPELIRMLYQYGIRDATITNYSRSFFRHSDSLFLSPTQMEKLNETIARLKAELKWEDLKCNVGVNDPALMSLDQKKSSWLKRAGCSGGKSSMAITPSGHVILCEQMPQEEPFIVGNVRENTLQEVWYSPRVAQFVFPPKESFQSTSCEQCDEFDDCHCAHGRCFRDAYFVYGKLNHPSPNCPKAPAAVRMG